MVMSFSMSEPRTRISMSVRGTIGEYATGSVVIENRTGVYYGNIGMVIAECMSARNIVKLRSTDSRGRLSPMILFPRIRGLRCLGAESFEAGCGGRGPRIFAD